MSQPYTPDPSEPGPESGTEESGTEAAGTPVAPAAKRSSFRERYVRLPQRRRTRWLALGAAVAVLGVIAGAAVVVADHHHDSRSVRAYGFADGPGGPFAAGPFGPGFKGGEGPVFKGGEGPVFKDGGPVFKGGDGPGNLVKREFGGVPGGGQELGGKATGPMNGGGRLAPAPLPAVPADQAVAKAAAAVPGGKVDALSVVGREGGGSSWAVDVLGSDGVRHLVTVDGTDGSITGNTVNDGR